MQKISLTWKVELQFDKNKNLQSDITLSCGQFRQFFGYNKEREKKIDNLFKVAEAFKKIGCAMMFVFGSFATARENPNDIDVCFDISNLETSIVEKKYSLFDRYERRRFKEYLSVHVLLKETKDDEIVELIKFDKEKNKRGIIEVSLKDLPTYDKK